MPTAYGAEFRRDVIDVARKGEAPLTQIAKDLGLSVTTLKRWITIAERKEAGAGPAAAQSAEMRELRNATACWSRRMKFCAGLLPIWPGTSTQNDPSMGLSVEAHAGADDDVEGPVELAVSGAVESVPGRVAGGRRAWGDAAECGEGSLWRMRPWWE